MAKPAERKLDIINFKIHKVTPNGAMSGKSDARAQKRRQNLVQHWKFKPQNPAEIYISYPTGFSKLRRNSEPTIQNFVSHFKVDPKQAAAEGSSKPLSSLSQSSTPSTTTLQSLPKQGFFSYKLPKEPSSNGNGAPTPTTSPSSPTRASPMPPPPPKSVMALDCPGDLPSAAFLRRYSVPVVRFNATNTAMEEDPKKGDFPTELAPFSDTNPHHPLIPHLPPLHDLLSSMKKTRIEEGQGSAPSSPQPTQLGSSTPPPTVVSPPMPALVSAIKPTSPPHSQITTYEFPPRKPRVTFADTTSPTGSPTTTTSDANSSMDLTPTFSQPERMSITTLVDPKKTKRSQSVPNIMEPNMASSSLYNIPTSRMSVASLVQN